MVVIRTTRAGDIWSLQTVIDRMVHPQTGRRVDVVAMIHIARAEYYAEVVRLMEGRPALVLYEGVGELTPAEEEALTEDERRVYASLASLHGAYRRIAASLALVAQPDAMPKPLPDWVRADLPVRDLLERWVRGRLPLLPVMDAAGRALDSAVLRRTTRLLLLQEPLILGGFQFLRGVAPGLGRLASLLIDERNAAALAAFDATEPGRDVIITYGAGHVPGLIDGLRARGYVSEGRDWVTALDERVPYSNLLDYLRPPGSRSQAPR